MCGIHYSTLFLLSQCGRGLCLRSPDFATPQHLAILIFFPQLNSLSSSLHLLPPMCSLSVSLFIGNVSVF